MFSGRLVNRFAGTSKKGNPFYTVDIFVDVDQNKRVLYKGFIDESLYKYVSIIPLDSIVNVKCGVNDYGNLSVIGIEKSK